MVERRSFPAVALLVLLAACSSGSGGYDSVADLAAALGCSATVDAQPAALARETGSCDFAGERVELGIYSAEALGQGRSIMRAAGTNAVVGETWVASATSAAVARRMQDRLGGELLP